MKKVGFLIFCLFAMCSMAGKAQDVVADSTGYIVKVGEMAPDFTVKLTDGKSITLSGLRGKVVMLQFTAQSEIPVHLLNYQVSIVKVKRIV